MEKTNFKKLVSLSLATMLCASVPAISANGAFATDGAPAGGGEPVPVEDNSFVVEETAAIRVSDPAGMRFYANIGADLVDDVQSADEFGFLIFPHAYLAEDENAGKADWQVKGIEGNAEYGLWDYVKVSTTEMDGLIYQRETDGKYCVNGVLHTVVDEDMEFSAIAYYVKDGEPVYADFNKDFSRSLSYVAKWAYLNEPTKRTDIADTFDWFDDSEFTIDSGADLQRLSNVVRADNPLEGLNFKLSKTIAVDGSTFTPVPTEFAGKWNWNNSAILVVADEDDTTDDERAFVSDTYNKVATDINGKYYRNGVAVRSAKLIDATKSTFTNKNGVTTNRTTEIVKEADGITGEEANYVNYVGPSMYFTATTIDTASQIKEIYKVTVNGWRLPWVNNATTNADVENDVSCNEMNAIKELYSGVKVRFYVSFNPTHANYICWDGAGTGLVGSSGYNSGSATVPKGYWIEKQFTIDELIAINYSNRATYADQAVSERYSQLPVGNLYFKAWTNITTATFYLGDCVFVK